MHSPKNKFFIIVNPTSGGGLAKRLWPEIVRLLKRKGYSFDFKQTKGAGDAEKLASKAAKDGYSEVIAYGGDGTIHEVANGLCATPATVRPTLGILSVGTGGDFAKTLRIPKNLKKQVNIITGTRSRFLDLGRVTFSSQKGKKKSRIFINIADAGLGAEVIRRVGKSRTLFGRKLAYLTSTLDSYLTWKPLEISIKTEGSIHSHTWPKNVLEVVVANGRYFGGGMPIAPNASPEDGLLDLVVIGELNPLMATLAIPLLYGKQLSRLPQVIADRVRSVTLTSKERVDLQIDGELIGSLPATFEILPLALEVKAP